MNQIELYRLLEPYRPTPAQMPWAYSTDNPNGRPLSNDMVDIAWLPAWAKPWQKVPRIWRARRAPLPFKQTSGNGTKEWMLIDPDYPLSPGTITEIRPYTTVNGTFNLLHALVDCASDDGAATFAAYLGGQWREVAYQYHKAINIPFFGRKVLKHFHGLRPDINVSPPETLNGKIRSDMMCWILEFDTTLV